MGTSQVIHREICHVPFCLFAPEKWEHGEKQSDIEALLDSGDFVAKILSKIEANYYRNVLCLSSQGLASGSMNNVN